MLNEVAEVADGAVGEVVQLLLRDNDRELALQAQADVHGIDAVCTEVFLQSVSRIE